MLVVAERHKMILKQDVRGLILETINLVHSLQESEANLRISNFYHRKKRTFEEYTSFLRLIYEDEGYNRADKQTQEAISKALYMLDKRYGSRQGEVFVLRQNNTYQLMKRTHLR